MYCTNLKRLIHILAVFCILPTFAQDEMQVQLMGGTMEQVVLPTGNGTVAGSCHLDAADKVSLFFGSPRTTLTITLTSPSGESYVTGSSPRDGVSNVLFPAPDEPNITGVNYVFVLQEPEVGTWQYLVEDSQSRSEESVVFVQQISNSPIKAAVIGGGLDYVVDEPMSLAVTVLEGAALLNGYTVNATLQHADATTPAALSLADDGSSGDQSAGDGVSTGLFTPTQLGNYWFRGRIEGSSQSGAPFVRDVATQFRVVAARGSIQGSFQDRGIDDDADGLLDRIGIELPLQVVEGGAFLLSATLTTALGQTLHTHEEVTLVVGSQSAEVFFDTKALRELGENGPYELSNVLLEYQGGDDAYLVDRAEALGSTSAWDLSQFEREPIELRGALTATGTDFDNNGLYDRFHVGLGLDLLQSGYYRWSARLVDPNGTELGFDHGAAYMNGQVDLNLDFAGQAIGENGVDGPYSVRNFIIYGAGTSRIINLAGETPLFTASQFEGYVNPDTEPPELALHVTPDHIWPPNHKMVEIQVTWDVTDNMDLQPVVRLESVVSSDGENEIGDGNHSNDIEISEDGVVMVRAERAGPGEGRIYTITFSATDAAGNQTMAEATVTVPHSNNGR